MLIRSFNLGEEASTDKIPLTQLPVKSRYRPGSPVSQPAWKCRLSGHQVSPDQRRGY